MREDQVYMIYIGECIQRIETYTNRDKESFFNNTLIQDAVLMNLLLLAESTARLSDQIKLSNPQVDWRGLSGFHRVLEFPGVNLATVWDVVERFIPTFKNDMEDIMKELVGMTNQ